MLTTQIRHPRGIDSFFRITERASDIRTEFKAGIATFLSLSYIFVLAPSLMRYTNLNAPSALVFIICISAVISILSGIFTNIPFVFAPGLEMLLFLSYVTMPLYLLGWGETSLCVLLSGLFLLLLSRLKQASWLHGLPPKQYSAAVAVTMSVFLLAQAIQIVGFTSYDNGWVHFGTPHGTNWLIGLSGAIIALVLDALGIPAPVLISLLAVAVLVGRFEPTVVAHNGSAGITQVVENLWRGKVPLRTELAGLKTIFTLLALSLWGSLSKVLNYWQGVPPHHQDAGDTKLPVAEIDTLLSWEGISGAVSGACGISNVTMFVESAAGIRSGGRTGLTSIVAGVSMLFAFILVPSIRFINPICSVGALVYVGILFFPKADTLKHVSRREWAVIVAMAIMVIGWMSLFWALLFGMIGIPLARRIRFGQSV